MHLGTISDFGLELLAKEILNTSLLKLAFEEDKEKPFSQATKDEFWNTLASEELGTIQKVKAKMIDDDERIEYFCDKRKEYFKKTQDFRKRNKSLGQKSLVDKIIGDIEHGKPQKVMVKKYFKNTFGDLLNDAMYELTRKQLKYSDKKDEYFSVEGCCKFVGEFLLENLPEHEKESLQNEKEEEDDKKDNDVE